MTRAGSLALAVACVAAASASVRADPASPPIDAAKPGGVAAPADAWPVAVVDRPLTLARGMAAVSLNSLSIWNPATSERSYFGPTAAFALHDRVELDAGLPQAICWDRGTRGCTGGSALDQSYLGLGFGIRHRDGLALAAGLTQTLVKASGPAEHATSIGFTARRTWFHRLALSGIGQLARWEHPADAASSGVAQTNQTRFYWTEQIEWQVIERLRVYVYGNPYRPIGGPATSRGRRASAAAPRWRSASAGCSRSAATPKTSGRRGRGSTRPTPPTAASLPASTICPGDAGRGAARTPAGARMYYPCPQEVAVAMTNQSPSKTTEAGPRRPPFRADHVGSFLRPPELLAARERYRLGEIDRAALRAVEDQAIRGVVAMQEDAGLLGVTDGEFRRTFFHIDFLEQLAGVATKGAVTVKFHNRAGDVDFAPPVMSVTGKVAARAAHPARRLQVPGERHHADAQGVDPVAHHAALPRRARGDQRRRLSGSRSFFDDVAAAYRAEIRSLGGGRLPISAARRHQPRVPVRSEMRRGVRARGDDPDELPRRYARFINAAIADRPAGLTICVHLCRGNFQSAWVAEGGYEPVAEVLFNELDVDGYFLEYDDERSGDFAPLRFVPRGKRVVLGLVSSKLGELEDAGRARAPDRRGGALRADRAAGAVAPVRLLEHRARQRHHAARCRRRSCGWWSRPLRRSGAGCSVRGLPLARLALSLTLSRRRERERRFGSALPQ